MSNPIRFSIEYNSIYSSEGSKPVILLKEGRMEQNIRKRKGLKEY
jgi:hypothetical protein